MNNDDLDNDIRDLVRGGPADKGFKRTYGKSSRSTTLFDFTAKRKRLILVAAGIVFVIVLIALLSGGGSKLSRGELTSMQAQVKQLEERLVGLEATVHRLSVLEKQAVESRRLMTEKWDQLAYRVDRLQRMIPSSTQIRGDTKRKPTALVEGRYYEVQPGDSLSGIARQHGISVDVLCRLNNITPEEFIHPGQKLVVNPGGRQ